jgi:hypothetical protein
MNNRVLSVTSACLLCILSVASAGNPGTRGFSSAANTTMDDLYRPFMINNVFNYYGNNGDGSFNKFSTSNEGFEFTKGTGKTCIFEDGVVWGGYHKGRTEKNPQGIFVVQAKVGGSTYMHGLSAGPIVQWGTATTDPLADDPTNPANRIYRVRPDVNPKTPFADVQSTIITGELPSIGRYESYTAQEIYDQYIQDWNQWPGTEGAPFAYGKDSNNVQRVSGPYDPRFDIPGRPGADQTLWYVSNDCNASRTASVAGSPLIGLEMRRTIWGYNRAGALGLTIFASTVLINKSGAVIDTMYIAQWADPDLGDGGDDFVGCDTSRSLGFVYNGKASDAVFGTQIPAAGFDILQGPIAPGGPGDTAAFLSQKRAGFRNLPMTSFTFATQGFPIYTDPPLGAGGDVEWYRQLRGMIPSTGSMYIDPSTNQPTKFCLAGDPLTHAGWYDGMAGLTPQDRRFCMAAGPFTMASGDTQEIVVAVMAALGPDYLSSITALRSADDRIQTFYNAQTGVGPLLGIAMPPGRVPAKTELMQNYPNPFNPSTVIRYSLAARSNVTLSVFNELGQVVARPVHEIQEAGSHEVRFSAEGMASGVYFYRLQAGESTSTRKFVLVR